MKANILLTLIGLTFCLACDKFLLEKSDKKLVTLHSLDALQATLDNPNVSVTGFCYSGELSADDYYLTNVAYTNLSDEIQRRYRWEPTELFQNTINDWQNSYRAIYASNMVLDALKNIEKDNDNTDVYNSIKGQALVLRGLRFLDLASVFCLAYDESTSATDLGLPLRLDPDFNSPSVRASLHETYNQIIEDLKTSASLLPLQNINVYRASKPLAYALLARTYLYMRQYPQAALYADSCLQLRQELLDFNTIDLDLRYPIPFDNNEVIFQGSFYHASFSQTNLRIDQGQYDRYDEKDLRRRAFFSFNTNDDTWQFRGTYSGRSSITVAPMLSEIWLVKAECHARNEEYEQAVHCINRLLDHRMEMGSFEGFDINQIDNILDAVLDERRKELLLRGVRWMDVKRLNKEGRNISLRREVGNDIYALQANDLRFALPLPDDVVELSKMPQNPR